MRYVSTRGAAPALGFDDVLLAGLAADGGLYVPESWPRFAEGELAAMAGLPYAELAARVMAPYLGQCIPAGDFAALVKDAYAGFGHPAVVPLRQLGPRLWLMELFHGPTLAFKDLALQVLGRLYDHVLRRRGERVTVVAATSGDTGSAAIEACRGREAIELYVLHPLGRVSEVQRRQMTTVLAQNVCNIAIEGTFDDCQALVKALFNDRRFRQDMRLSAVNSINWVRIMAQIPYYVAAVTALGAAGRRVSFAVPTGNFGNVYAGYAARAMGLPVERLIVACNRNDILARFFASGTLAPAEVEPSLSPSMDIQAASNLERLLFDLYERDGEKVVTALDAFHRAGRLDVGEARLARARAAFDGFRLDDAGTLAVMSRIRRQTGVLVDPHTAVALAAAESLASGGPTVVLATAHPAKFPEAVHRATGEVPALPAALADLYERPERVEVLPNEKAALAAFIRDRSRLRGAA